MRTLKLIYIVNNKTNEMKLIKNNKKSKKNNKNRLTIKSAYDIIIM